MTETVHVVCRFSAVQGAEIYARELVRKLIRHGKTARLWATDNTPVARQMGATPISSYALIAPYGGTLVLVGSNLSAEQWLDATHPRRLVVICNLVNPGQIYAFLARLERSTLPAAELVFVSERQRRTLALPGRITPLMIDLERFIPKEKDTTRPFTIGRHSRDTPEKHHPLDPSLYKTLTWKGIHTKVLGGICLRGAINTAYAEIQLLPFGTLPSETFLNQLDCFFYRTAPECSEAAGQVVLEAMACGLPIIAHTSGGYTDWIEPGINGLLFNTQEEAMFCVRQLQADVPLRRTIADNARGTAVQLESNAQHQVFSDWLSLA